MSSFGPRADLQPQEIQYLPSKGWSVYVNTCSAMVDEAKRVIKSGGLQEPGIAAHLMASRIAASTAVANSLDS